MTIGEWLGSATKQLAAAGIGSARLDALILLEDELGRDRSQLLAHTDFKVSKTREKRLNSKLKRRCRHVPMAQIRGFSEFYGRKFLVNRHTLEPRPESEEIINLLKQLPLPTAPIIADVGTGTGCLGITAALEIPGIRVDLFDIDSSALAVAKHNAQLHEVALKAYKRDLLRNVAKPYDIVLANLPYVPEHFKLNEAAAMEPRIAIFGGADGLELYRRLFHQLALKHWKPGFVLTECLPPQHSGLSLVASHYGFKPHKTEGFVQVFKLG